MSKSESQKRRWRPAPYLPKTEPELEPQARDLSRLARAILDQVPNVLLEVTAATQEPVAALAYEEGHAAADRAWSLRCGSIRAFCIVDEDAERALLRYIVGGAPRRRLSEIERRITGEAIARLLEGQHCCEVSEIRLERPAPPSWHCSVRIGALDQSAVLNLFTSRSPQREQSNGRPRVERIALPLRATLATGSCDLASILRWQSGGLVRLSRGLDADVFLFAAGRRIARARLGALHGERALMLTELLPAG
ncbi:MAG TPA: FliM/FliN family flagellar motor switch protein [Candidatus Acidoferrales bacterium]|nr:FliM/FliN family flagellar motor switch protein [Candidatus Acidoferrales bacterium]